MTENEEFAPLVKGEDETEAPSEEIQLHIFPTATGVVLDLGNGNALALGPDDVWRLVGRLINAVTVTHLNAVEEEKKSKEQHDRIRRLIESGSNVPKD